MFQSKPSSIDPNPANINPQTALPNNYGNIRTLKKDFEDSKSGKSSQLPANDFATAPQQYQNQATAAKEPAFPQMPSQSIPAAAPPSAVNMPSMPIAPKPNLAQAELPKNSFSAPIPSSINPKNTASNFEEAANSKNTGASSPFGTENFYQDQQASFENIGEELKKNVRTSSGKSSKIALWLVIIVILLAGGGGAYYWWFYMKDTNMDDTAANSSQQSAPESSEAATPEANGQNSSSSVQSQSGKFHQWALDLSSDKIASKLAIKRYISEFASSAAEGNIIEAKIVSTDNQAILPVKFEEIFDFKLPTAVQSALTDEYSIFAKKETGETRMGGVFKLSQTAGVGDSIKNEESALASNLKSFYLDANLSSAPVAFNSNKYNQADIRYVNFASPANTSLDYTIISGTDSAYFIFATSKGTLRSIIDYMSEK